MDGLTLRDKVSRGMGRAAIKLGTPFSVFRPTGSSQPCSTRNHVINLLAQMSPGGGNSASSGVAKAPLWTGVFDTSYTRPGDYLVGTDATFFIAFLPDNEPAKMVLTNRLISITRETLPGLSGYAGLTESTSSTLLSPWPASLLRSSAHGSIGTKYLTELSSLILLLPDIPINPEAGDVITDDLDQTYLVSSAEHSLLGWSVSVRQTSA